MEGNRPGFKGDDVGVILKQFENQTAVVTGGVRGIGLAITEKFLKEGAFVVMVDVDGKQGEKVLAQLGGNAASFVPADLTRLKEVERAVSTIVEERDRIDILINNAGVIRDNVIWKMPEEDFDFVMGVNLKGPWLMSRAVIPVMRKHNFGRIVNISSRAWLGNFGQSNYSASKGGVVSLTRTIALEVARFNITVNAVAPGLIDTDLTRSLPEEVLSRLVETQPSKKMGRPGDVASAVVFLASSEASFITGQVIHVDGGKSVGFTTV